MTTDQKIEVMRAYDSGKQIQARTRGGIPDDRWPEGEKWHDCLPNWDFYRCDFRVKPEPRDWWVVYEEERHGFELTRAAVYSVKQNQVEKVGRKQIHVREVIE